MTCADQIATILRMAESANPQDKEVMEIIDQLDSIPRDCDDALLEQLSKLLDHADQSLVVATIETLGKIGSNVPVKKLFKLVGDSDIHTRTRAIKAIEKIGTNEAVEHLIKALSDNNADVRGKAAIALASVGSLAAIPFLESLQEDNTRLPWGVVGKAAEVAVNSIRVRAQIAEMVIKSSESTN